LDGIVMELKLLGMLSMGSTGFTVGSGTLVAVTSNPTTITGLSANTSYDLYVQADCGSGTVSSWVGPITVTN
jgi:hypothetical protein